MLVTTLRGHKRGVWAAQFSPVDQAVATASGDKTLRLWALADGTCLKTFEGHTASVLRLNFLSAGSQVSPCWHSALHWYLKTKRKERKFAPLGVITGAAGPRGSPRLLP